MAHYFLVLAATIATVAEGQWWPYMFPPWMRHHHHHHHHGMYGMPGILCCLPTSYASPGVVATSGYQGTASYGGGYGAAVSGTAGGAYPAGYGGYQQPQVANSLPAYPSGQEPQTGGYPSYGGQGGAQPYPTDTGATLTDPNQGAAQPYPSQGASVPYPGQGGYQSYLSQGGSQPYPSQGSGQPYPSAAGSSYDTGAQQSLPAYAGAQDVGAGSVGGQQYPSGSSYPSGYSQQPAQVAPSPQSGGYPPASGYADGSAAQAYPQSYPSRTKMTRKQ